MSRRNRDPDAKETERVRELILARKHARLDWESQGNYGKPREGSGWDRGPAGFEGMTVGEVVAHAPAMLQFPSMKPSVLPTAMVTPNQLKQARRLYVGNIPINALNETSLKVFFNAAFSAAGLDGIDGNPPVVSVQVNLDKNYAFLEFEHSVICTEALNLDGIILEGNTLKLRRPKDYIPLPESYKEEGELPERIAMKAGGLTVPGLCSTTVPDSPWKLYCGGLPFNVTEAHVKELLNSFGALRAFNMVKDKVKGSYCFFEYADHDVTDTAVAGLNGMKVGDKALLVQRSCIAPTQAPLETLDTSNPVAYCLSLQIPLATAVMQCGALNPNTAGSSTLVLMNLFKPKDLASDADYEDSVADVRQELQQYGKIRSLLINRPSGRGQSEYQVEGDKPDAWAPGLAGFVFCKYESTAEALTAQRMLQGRKFNGRTVVSMLQPEQEQDL